LEGQTLLGLNKKANANEGLNYNQKKAMEAFRFLLLHGGETAELIEKNVLDFARKKQNEVDSQNLATPQKLSKSA
jgi:hypothetical protein